MGALTLYSACLLRVLRVRAHGRLVVGIVAQDIPILHRALSGEREREREREIEREMYGVVSTRGGNVRGRCE